MTEKFQTGIDVFDASTGGIYPGLIVLIEETGAGGREFALTSLMNLSKSGIEGELVYISMTANDEEVRREFRLSFPYAGEEWIGAVEVVSLSKEYFARSIIPISWISDEGPSLASLKSRSLLERLIEVFEHVPERSLIVMDSLTLLARKTDALGGEEIAWKDLIDLLIGIRKIVIKKRLLSYLLLTKGVVGRSREEEIFSTADGIIVFEWMEEKETMKRTMYVKRMVGTLAVLEKQRFGKFDVSIDPAVGFMISKLHRII
jgi:KaiC/GvpD/RAD55 family RecA-like ATPase